MKMRKISLQTDIVLFKNGVKIKNYTFKYDYYWMMGDNRHNSADSRDWGFVPESHILGKPLMVLFSIQYKGVFDSVRIGRTTKQIFINSD